MGRLFRTSLAVGLLSMALAACVETQARTAPLDLTGGGVVVANPSTGDPVVAPTNSLAAKVQGLTATSCRVLPTPTTVNLVASTLTDYGSQATKASVIANRICDSLREIGYISLQTADYTALRRKRVKRGPPEQTGASVNGVPIVVTPLK